jgi:hypothetical protein
VRWPERALAAVAAGFLIFPNPMTDAVGFALAAAFFGWRLIAGRRAGRTRIAP